MGVDLQPPVGDGEALYSCDDIFEAHYLEIYYSEFDCKIEISYLKEPYMLWQYS